LLCQHLPAPLPTAYLCIPLSAQNETFGLLHLSEFSGAPGRLTEEKHQLAVTLAEHVSLAVANLKLRETLHSQSVRDPLTGLFNRRYMEESLDREVYRAKRSDRPLGIIMLDLDHFKEFNDTFGHEAGDVLLRELGSFLQRHIRRQDIACRYGGEEFTLILPEASLEVTRERAEQLLKRIEQLQVDYQGQVLGTLSVSAGVAALPDQGSNSEAVLRAADGALYQAKAQGRNRVSVAQ
jgi:diguanylate cyclase (GGDEF)-like protein